MGQFVTPQVYLIGYTGIDWPEFKAYLSDSGNMDFIGSVESAVGQGLHLGEILCSFYAKLCYASLTLGKNDNVTKIRDIPNNLQSCLSVGHSSILEHTQLNFVVRNCSRVFCYHPDTEIFSARNGWVRLTAIHPDDIVLTLDPRTRKARWSPVLSMHEFDYEGKLYGWSNSEHMSPLMTPEHILWAARYDIRAHRGVKVSEIASTKTTKIRFDELFGKRFVIQHDIVKSDDWFEETITIGKYKYDAYLLFAWLGWMSTDGGFSKDRPSQSIINQNKVGNLPGLHDLMSKLFSNRWRRHGPYTENGTVLFIISDKDLADFAREHLGEDKISRKFSQWLLDADKRLLHMFHLAAMRGDGTHNKQTGHKTLYCPSYVAAGQWQYIFAKLGYPANLRVDDRRGQFHLLNDQDVINNRVMWQIEVDRRCNGSLIADKHQIMQPYTGKVYCPKTDDGIVYIRGAGQPFWAGNTHELTRHRVGTAFSQTSGRYVRGDTINLIFDPILEPIREEGEELLRIIEEYYQRMVSKMSLNDMTDFNKKKKVTSALRRFLPNGQSNEIGFSCNLRALRHIIQMRTSRHAEWEIRFVFNQVYDICVNKFPLIFCDAKVEEVDGLTEVSGMKLQP